MAEYCASKEVIDGAIVLACLLPGEPPGSSFRVTKTPSAGSPSPAALEAAYHTGPGMPFLDGEPPKDGKWYVIMDRRDEPSLARWNQQEGYFVNSAGSELEDYDFDVYCPFPVEIPR